MAGSSTSAPSAPLVCLCREGGELVVGDGDDDQLHLLDEGLRLGEGPSATGQTGHPLPSGRIPAGDRLDRPTGSGQGQRERAADRTATDDASGRALPRPGVLMRVLMPVGVDVVPVAVVPRWGRVQVDAGGLDGGLGLGTVALGVVPRERPPRLHRRPAAAAGRSRYASTQRV
jgi:hypothetical protein